MYNVVIKEDNPRDGAYGAVGASYLMRIGCDRFATLRLTLDVILASGTNPTLDVELEHSETESGPWRSLGTFAQKTSVSSERKTFAGADRFVRTKFTIGGTSPQFRFNLKGEGV